MLNLFNKTKHYAEPLETDVAGSGPPLFLVSGMFAGGWLWNNSLTALTAHHTVYRIRDALCEVSSNMDELSERTANSIRQLDAGPVILSGASLGGIIALMVAARYPQLTAGVAICGSPGKGLINLGVGAPKRGNRDWANAVRDKIMYDSSLATEEDFSKIYRLFEQRKTTLNIIRLARAAKNLDVDELMKNIDSPVHGIWGEEDEVTPLTHWDYIAKKHTINIDVIAQAGHVPMYEKPELFSDYLLAFSLAEQKTR